MSTATAAPPADAVPPRGKKKLLMIIGAAVLALVLAAAGGVVYLKSRAAAAAEAEGDEDTTAQAEEVAHRDPKHAPTFVALDPFTVNLADRESERYAQVGISLELEDGKDADRIKTYMPVIRNNILMVLAHKTSTELLERDGKTRLAQEIRRETARALGVAVGEPEGAGRDAADAKAGQPAKKKAPTVALPIAAVHFSNFIIQ